MIRYFFISKYCLKNLFLFKDLRNEEVLVGAINEISFTFPSFCPLTQPEELSDDLFCDDQSRPASCKDKKICPCVHRLKVKLNATVELVVVDESASRNIFQEVG